jgi:hypothetical protein
METSVSASKPRQNNIWIPDYMANSCLKCKKAFGLFVRKHHCRLCGNIFCGSCTLYMFIPEFIGNRIASEDIWNPSYYIVSLRGKDELVCLNCNVLILNKIKTKEIISNLIENPKPIDEIMAMNASLIDVKSHYFNHLRDIQYYLPNHKYSDTDKKFLRVNAHFFSQHSKYIVHLIKSIFSYDETYNIQIPHENTIDHLQSSIYNNHDDTQLIITVLNNKKNIICSEIGCTRTCNEELSVDDCINILYSTAHVLPKSILEILFGIISKTPTAVFIKLLPFFVTLIKLSKNNAFLHNEIYKIIIADLKMTYQIYWLLNIVKETANLEEIMNINNFIELFDSDLQMTLYYEFIFFKGIINNLHRVKQYLTEYIGKKEISIPYEPSIKIISAELDKIEVLTSCTKPVIIPFITTSGKIKILFKKEAILNDLIIMNLMTLTNIIISEHIDIENAFTCIIYPMIPLTTNSGIIEIVENAKTIYDIETSGSSILRYILSKNENQVVSAIIDKYMCSLVLYTLHSYFFGIGDRHKQNIMIAESGEIFHIDFGFILGNDPYPMTSGCIKLNSKMIEVIGDVGSERYEIYLTLCSEALTLLRKYYNLFFVMLSQNPNVDINTIQKFILQRFQPKQSDKIAVDELFSIIEQSKNAYSDAIRDIIHSQSRSTQNGIQKAIKTASDLIKKLYN